MTLKYQKNQLKVKNIFSREISWEWGRTDIKDFCFSEKKPFRKNFLLDYVHI